MSNKETSTAQSYVDQVTGAAQSVLGSLTGNPADKREGENRRATGEAREDLSHATAKAGPINFSSSGAVTTDDPNRTQGSWDQTVGSGKETLGNLIGNESLKQSGARQNEEGKAREAQGQLSDLGSGISDRVGGAVGGAVAGLTGDREAQRRYEQQHDTGKTQQRGVEADLQKQADAERRH